MHEWALTIQASQSKIKFKPARNLSSTVYSRWRGFRNNYLSLTPHVPLVVTFAEEGFVGEVLDPPEDGEIARVRPVHVIVELHAAVLVAGEDRRQQPGKVSREVRGWWLYERIVTCEGRKETMTCRTEQEPWSVCGVKTRTSTEGLV